MTLSQGEAPQRSPWLSIWFSPRSTIERIVASSPRRHVLLLASLGTASTFVASLIDRGSTIELFDWRIIALIALGGATFGIANLYITGLFLKWGGRMLGGRASAVEMRAVFAWGYAQSVVGLVIFVIALTGLALYRGADGPRLESSMLVIALPVVWQVLALWALVATMLMLGRVQRFGFWRTGHYFMMGDNRDNSTDSRVRPENGGVGYVPFENLVGRAEIIFFSINRDDPNQPAVRFDRIGTIVR